MIDITIGRYVSVDEGYSVSGYEVRLDGRKYSFIVTYIRQYISDRVVDKMLPFHALYSPVDRTTVGGLISTLVMLGIDV